MKAITFDLETVAPSGRPEILEIIRQGLPSPEYWRYDDEEEETLYRGAVSPEYCQIVSAAYAIGEQSPVGAAVGQTNSHNGDPLTEADLLRSLWHHLRDADRIVTFNGTWFDLRVLKFRSALLGVPTSRPDWVDLKPWDKTVVDTFRQMWPNKKYTLSLKKAATVFNLPVQAEFQDLPETDGSDVAQLWADQDLDSLVLYNRKDIALTRELCRLFGGFYWDPAFVKWDDWDYETGEWRGDPPEGF